MVGEVVEIFGPRRLWHGFDPPSAQKMRNLRCIVEGDHDSHTCDIEGDPPVLRHTWVELVSPANPDVEVPEYLDGWCKRHGKQRVLTESVVNKV